MCIAITHCKAGLPNVSASSPNVGLEVCPSKSSQLSMLRTRGYDWSLDRKTVRNGLGYLPICMCSDCGMHSKPVYDLHVLRCCSSSCVLTFACCLFHSVVLICQVGVSNIKDPVFLSIVIPTVWSSIPVITVVVLDIENGKGFCFLTPNSFTLCVFVSSPDWAGSWCLQVCTIVGILVWRGWSFCHLYSHFI